MFVEEGYMLLHPCIDTFQRYEVTERYDKQGWLGFRRFFFLGLGFGGLAGRFFLGCRLPLFLGCFPLFLRRCFSSGCRLLPLLLRGFLPGSRNCRRGRLLFIPFTVPHRRRRGLFLRLP